MQRMSIILWVLLAVLKKKNFTKLYHAKRERDLHIHNLFLHRFGHYFHRMVKRN